MVPAVAFFIFAGAFVVALSRAFLGALQIGAQLAFLGSWFVIAQVAVDIIFIVSVEKSFPALG